MESFNKVEDLGRENYFSFEDDCRTLEERKKIIADIIKSKNDYLISKGYALDENGHIISSSIMMKDSIIGFAVGDALGVPVEFHSRTKMDKFPINNMLGYGTHLVPEGTWSDDTSMILATIDSIMETKKIDYDDIMNRFYDWLENGNYSALNTNFDVGITTKQAILRYKNGLDPLLCGSNEQMSNGNGSLMRILPIVYYLYVNNYNFDECVDIINNISSLTHSNEISLLGCKIFSDYVFLLLDGNDKIEAFNKLSEIKYSNYYTAGSIEIYNRILSGSISKVSRDEIKSTGYVVDTLEACLWSLLNSDSYESAVLTAVNLGGDTDTIGALTGALGGMIYGKKQIPKEWLYKLKKRDYLNIMSEKFISSLYTKMTNGKSR